MVSMMKRWINDDSGATAIEYGLLSSLIAVAIIGGVKLIGTKLSSTFDGIQNNLV